MTQAPDAALVARVLSGDTSAFGTLVDRYQDQMLAYALHMGFAEAEALDVVQEALIRAYRHLKRCKDPDRFAGWLFKIVSNVCKTHATRSAKRRTEPLESMSASLPLNAPGPDEAAEAESTRRFVRRALDSVPHEMKEALVLMYLHGRSVTEISEITGASPSAVKMRLKRGREALRDELAPMFQEVES